MTLSYSYLSLRGSTQEKKQIPPAVVFKLTSKSTVDASNRLGGTLNCTLNVHHKDGTTSTPHDPAKFAGNALLKLTVLYTP